MENQVYRRKGAVTTLQLTTLAILLAIRFALDYLPEIDLGVTKMGFGFVGAALTGAIAGPIPAMILGAAHDILKFALGGAKGVYFPGYTLTAIVGGLIYGLGLHRQTKTPLRIFLTVLAVTLICNLGLKYPLDHDGSEKSYHGYLASTFLQKYGFPSGQFSRPLLPLQ